ncbi:MAG: pseudouridine synthase [Desulfobacterales bacterium]|jgi:pseudouridine synthase
MTEMRLQKFLASAGVCSRRKGERIIKEGRVKVNGVSVSELGSKVDSDKDFVELDGQPVSVNFKPIYIALNKPKGYVSSCYQKNQKTVLDLVDIPERVYPVGRLDKNSTGLLLLTNDGHLHYRLSHPSFDHEKEYEVTVANPLPEGALRKLAQGLPLMGTKTRPARVKRISSRSFLIVLQEGKNRQIRRMIRKVGNQVTDLKRIRIANIKLGRLPAGRWRFIAKKEKDQLLKHL